MKRIAYIHNAKMKYSGYGNVYCSNCKNRVAVIPNNDYKYLFLVIICSCGTEVIYKSLEVQPDAVDELYIDIDKGPAVCRSCGKELFYVDRHRAASFSFHVTCSCGREYNRLFKRLNYNN